MPRFGREKKKNEWMLTPVVPRDRSFVIFQNILAR